MTFKLYRVTIRTRSRRIELVEGVWLVPREDAPPYFLTHDAFHVEPAEPGTADLIRRAALGAGADEVVEQPEEYADFRPANRAAFDAAQREGCRYTPFVPAPREDVIEWRNRARLMT